MLYESYIHPITILSTLPSAGVGAVLALLLFNTEFSIIALIGVILLIGIVKKNAIMMIDFALDAQRAHGQARAMAIYEAALLRFRPIMMTTMAAMLGALPLAFGTGDGAEMRQPLGISIVGGLIVSQMLTLYTTPVMYLYLDRFGRWCSGLWARAVPAGPPGTAGRDAGTGGRTMRHAFPVPPCCALARRLRRRTQLPPALGTRPADLQGGRGLEAGRAARRRRARSDWWSVYNDPVLDELEKQIDISNQTLKASEAAWREARALVSQARAAVPADRRRLTAAGTRSSARARRTRAAPRARSPPRRPASLQHLRALAATATWDLDIWGKIRRTVESQVANTQASEAELAAARLSAQATLATDYVDLRVADETRKLLDETVAAFQRSLHDHAEPVQGRHRRQGRRHHRADPARGCEVAAARDRRHARHARARHRGAGRQGARGLLASRRRHSARRAGRPDRGALDAARAQSDGRRRRAQHGRRECADRRGDRRVLPGPDALGQPTATRATPSRICSRHPTRCGPSAATATETLFDFGAALGPGATSRVRPTIEAVANYRQAVLVAFQQVEDQLATLRILEAQYAVQDQTVQVGQRGRAPDPERVQGRHGRLHHGRHRAGHRARRRRSSCCRSARTA